MAHRRHQGAAGGSGDGFGRQPAADLHRPGDRRVNGLQNTLPVPPGGTPTPDQIHPSGTVYGPTPNTNTCHDVTAFTNRELVAGACQGNGILLNVEDPVNPVRLDAVSDPNYSYWHSATFNNDGTKVIFTDEWGGGTSARCRVTDQPEWVPTHSSTSSTTRCSSRATTAAGTADDRGECVAHNGSIIPVPGRDIHVQAWYQGGLSVIDFTDTANPVEIAFFDRGPIRFGTATGLNLGGFWATYYYNGNIFGTEIARGFDTFKLEASDMLSQNEIDAASEIVLAEFNSQLQSELVSAPSFNVAGSYFDQAVRGGDLTGKQADKVGGSLAKAEKLEGKGETASAIEQLNNAVKFIAGDPDLADLEAAIIALRDTLA